MKFINIGYGNMVAAGRVILRRVSRLCADKASRSRTRKRRGASSTCRAADAPAPSSSRTATHVILSAIGAETISYRLNGQQDDEDESEEDE
jgi:regulator of extracellular matrix RemA (YlzA/DUF370 family)